MERDQPKSKLQIIEFARGFAAMLVVFHHAGSIMAQPRFFGTEPFAEHLRNFNVGVDFFFVLSGFLITWVHFDDIGRKERLGNFARKRFLRIYPPYWGIVIPLIILYALFPAGGVPSQRDPVNVVLSLLLLPYTAQPVLGVAWTLTHEILFYVLFAIILLAGRIWLLLFPLWAVAIVVANVINPDLPFPLSFLLSPFNLEFLLGTAIAFLVRNRQAPLALAWIVAGSAAFVALMLFATRIQDNMLVARIAFGLASAVFVIGAVSYERNRSVVLPAVMGLFGAASYAIYLAHPVALSFGVQLLSRVPGSHALPLDVIALILVVFGTTAGIVYHLALEKRLIRLARYVLDNSPLFGARRKSPA